MKGVVLAGGLGTRLDPLTRVTNKHLLPICEQPMICYPLQTLRHAGIDEVLLVTGREHAGDFLKLLGDGRRLGFRALRYTFQEGSGGIAEALLLAEDFTDGCRICVIFGDNIIEGHIRSEVDAFAAQQSGARILLKEVERPEHFGVPRFEGERIAEIIEKPEHPPSRYAVTGICMYDGEVFNIIRTLEPSPRGELEITDVNNTYLQHGNLTHGVLEGWWTDAGTFESLDRVNRLVSEGGANKIGQVLSRTDRS